MSQKARHGVDDNPNHIPDNRAAGDIGPGCFYLLYERFVAQMYFLDGWIYLITQDE